MNSAPAWLTLLALAGVHAAVAGDIHKCTIAGRTVFQDKPCPDGAVPGKLPGTMQPAGMTNLPEASDMSLEDLTAEVRRIHDLQSKANDELRERADQLRRSYDAEKDGETRREEFARFTAWRNAGEERRRALEERLDSLHAEIGRRCPSGGQADGVAQPICSPR